MKKRDLLVIACACLAAAVLFPTDVLATKTSSFGAGEIQSKGKEAEDFIFGAIVPYVGGAVGGYKAISSLLSNNLQGLAVYGLTAISCLVLPSFISGVFGSSMLLP